ncbi:MAG: tetratricopeptide repeat protein [Dehalococcoidia bacterium]
MLERPAFLRRLPAIAPIAQRVWALALVALAAAWISFYLITPLPYIELETFEATVMLHAVTALVFIPYLVSLIVWRRLPGGSMLDLPIVGLIVVYLLATVGSLDWRLSLEVTLTAFMGLGVFYVLSERRMLRLWQVETAFMIAVLAAAVKALWIVGEDYQHWLELTQAVSGGLSLGDLIPPTVPKVHDVGDHPNLLGGIFAMSLPLFFAGMFRPAHVTFRVAATLGAGVIALALFLTVTRSAWIGAAVGVTTTAVLLAFATENGRGWLRWLWPSTPLGRGLLVAGAAAAIAVVVVSGLYATRSVEARPIWLFRQSDTPRWDVMEAGADMFQDYPFLGTGPGVFGLLYPEYSGRFPNHAFHTHNGYLQGAVDMGVLGALAILALAATMAWLIIRSLREAEGHAQFTLAAGAGALLAFGVFSLFDSPNGFKGPLVAMASVGAIIVLAAREGSGERDEPVVIALTWPSAGAIGHIVARAAVAIVMVGVLITWGVRLDVAHYHYSNAQANANAGNFNGAREEAQRAIELDPDFAVYHLQLGTILGETYLRTQNSLALRDAIAELEETTRLEPRSAVAHANMALLLAKGGDRNRARDEALAALEFANSDPNATLVAATALEEANWGDEAVAAYARALFLDAGLADSPFWDTTPFRQTRFPDIIGSSALVFNQCLQMRLALAGLPHGDLPRDQALDACRQQVQAAPNNDQARIELANALIQTGDLTAARTHIDYVLARKPDLGLARTALGRWYAAQGNTDTAREEWLRAGQLGETDALVLLGDSYPPGQAPSEVVRSLRGRLHGKYVDRDLVGILYYRFKFQRRSPGTIFLPGEWRRAVPGPIARAQDALDRWATAGRQ